MSRSSSFTRTSRAALAGALLLLVAQGVAVAGGAPGARSIDRGEVVVQRRADFLRPRPEDVTWDRGDMYGAPCHTEGSVARRCVFGDLDSDIRVVLTGDSTAMHHFPALEAVARTRGWRLIGMTKVGCSLALYHRKGDCHSWQQDAFEFIEADPPDMVITAGFPIIQVYRDGERLSPAESAPIVEDGWERAFRRLKRTGTKVVLMGSGPQLPGKTWQCVRDNRDDLRRCAVRRGAALGYIHTDLRGARRVQGIVIVNAIPLLCNERWCPAVIGNVIIHRATLHFTATWMKTMAGHLDDMLPEV